MFQINSTKSFAKTTEAGTSFQNLSWLKEHRKIDLGPAVCIVKQMLLLAALQYAALVMLPDLRLALMLQRWLWLAISVMSR